MFWFYYYMDVEMKNQNDFILFISILIHFFFTGYGDKKS